MPYDYDDPCGAWEARCREWEAMMPDQNRRHRQEPTMRTILSSTVRSHININGTDFPATVEVSRFAVRGRRPVFTAAVVCNGTAYGARDFGTRRECIDYAATLMGAQGRAAVTTD